MNIKSVVTQFIQQIASASSSDHIRRANISASNLHVTHMWYVQIVRTRTIEKRPHFSSPYVSVQRLKSRSSDGYSRYSASVIVAVDTVSSDREHWPSRL